MREDILSILNSVIGLLKKEDKISDGKSIDFESEINIIKELINNLELKHKFIRFKMQRIFSFDGINMEDDITSILNNVIEVLKEKDKMIFIGRPFNLDPEINILKTLAAKIKEKCEGKEFEMPFPLIYLKDPLDERDYKFSLKYKTFDSMISNLPPIVDHTPNMTPIRNQGQLGSCVGFAVAAMKEWQEAKEHKEEVSEGKYDHRKGKEYDLSEAWVYWNAKKIDAWPGEEGTSIRYAMKVLNKIGVPTEKGWPYKDVGDVGEPKSWAKMVAKWAWISDYWSVDNLDELKVALTKAPVPIGIACFEEIFYPDGSGFVRYPVEPYLMYGGHAVCAVGFDDTKQRIKFKNSWGTGWGKDGYGYIGYDYIKDFLWDAWACTDIRVRKSMLKETKSLYS